MKFKVGDKVTIDDYPSSGKVFPKGAVFTVVYADDYLIYPYYVHNIDYPSYLNGGNASGVAGAYILAENEMEFAVK